MRLLHESYYAKENYYYIVKKHNEKIARVFYIYLKFKT